MIKTVSKAIPPPGDGGTKTVSCNKGNPLFLSIKNKTNGGHLQNHTKRLQKKEIYTQQNYNAKL